jgi:hypothetical protein
MFIAKLRIPSCGRQATVVWRRKNVLGVPLKNGGILSLSKEIRERNLE